MAQAKIQVDFEATFGGLTVAKEPLQVPLGRPSRGYYRTVKLSPVGDSVVIQRVHLRRGFAAREDGTARIRLFVEGVDLHSCHPEYPLPRRLHRGETLHVTHDLLNEDDAPLLVRAWVDVFYTFGEEGQAGGSKSFVFSEENASAEEQKTVPLVD